MASYSDEWASDYWRPLEEDESWAPTPEALKAAKIATTSPAGFAGPRRSTGFIPRQAPKLMVDQESFFSRVRRAEIGVHHRMSGRYLSAYATEMAWREDHRRTSNGAQFNVIAALASRSPVSRAWSRYWQRSA
jgi:hypothetical protein